jgi:RNA polymerase sigma-70 factor (ECF subfamily)
MSPEGEAALVAAAAAGEAPAFSRLVQARQAAVRGFLRRLTGNHADADDLAQETFVTAWLRLDSFRPGESFRAWLCGIAWRKWLARTRSESRRLRREQAAAAPDSAPRSHPDQRLDAAAALGALPPEQRAAVALCLAAEFSHSEAAAALGLPLGTVKSHVSRGRAKLLERLGAAGEPG